jgi:hypothetical protein
MAPIITESSLTNCPTDDRAPFARSSDCDPILLEALRATCMQSTQPAQHPNDDAIVAH